jgi:hypothetical protein
MRCSARTWLSSACWLFMCPSLPASPLASSGDLVDGWSLLTGSEWRRGVRPESGTFPTSALAGSPSFGRRPLRPALPSDRSQRMIPARWAAAWRVCLSSAVSRSSRPSTRSEGGAAEGEPAVVLAGGEASVGKTRLVAELTSRCAADGTRVLVGGCVPADSRRPCGGHGQDRATANPPDNGRAQRSTLRREVELQSSPLPATESPLNSPRPYARIRTTRGPLRFLVAVETRCDSAHDEVLCHRSR